MEESTTIVNSISVVLRGYVDNLKLQISALRGLCLVRSGIGGGGGSKQSPFCGMSRVGCYLAKIVVFSFGIVIVAVSRGFSTEIIIVKKSDF